jgi:hypothetical protein
MIKETPMLKFKNFLNESLEKEEYVYVIDTVDGVPGIFLGKLLEKINEKEYSIKIITLHMFIKGFENTVTTSDFSKNINEIEKMFKRKLKTGN